MIIVNSGRKVAIGLDHPSARYLGTRELSSRWPGQRGISGLSQVRATVEIRCALGGMTPRALLGGQFAPGDSDFIEAYVLVSPEPLTMGREATCESALGRALVPGLPAEFAGAVLDGLQGNGEAPCPLPAGRLDIDRAGHDEVESSDYAFARTAGLLAEVLASAALGKDPAAAVEAALAHW